MQTPPRQPRGASSAARSRAHLTLLHPNQAPMLGGTHASVRRVAAPLDAESPAARIAPPVAFRAPADVIDLPLPTRPMSELEVAIDTLRHAAQADSVSAKGDAILGAMGHLTAALGELFDRETAQRFLSQLSRTL